MLFAAVLLRHGSDCLYAAQQNCTPLDSGDFTPCKSTSDFRALRAQR
jgi:hypothetical protein